jgi:small conductance mechanosensitive channel
VAYATDLTRALTCVRHVLEGNPRVLQDPGPVVGIGLLGDSSINIAAKPWVKVPDYIDAQAEIYQAIVERFQAENIEIPVRQLDVRMLNAVSA